MSDISAPPVAPAASTGEDKTVAIVAYITIIGFIAAIVIHSNKKTRLGAYHLRQCLGIFIGGFVGSILMIIPILGWIAAPLIWLFLLVCWIMGLIAAINGQMKPVPLIGEQFQKWFGTAFD
jgi:uncharacterized membrane protein